ncbi:Sodium/calcium exchanger protein-domain-containing protein [Mycena leptocephala]|nr:Sodium/calcium exchanger protein-domain-containing protein [Mycena leptocephala]
MAKMNNNRSSLRARRTTTNSVGEATRRSFNLRRAATSLFTPQKKIAEAPGILRSIRSILTASWLNVLLVFIPISWAFNFADKDQESSFSFVISFLAIIPLAKLLAFATDELSLRVGQTLAGLLNATLVCSDGLITVIIALTKCELEIVQSSLIGSILSNLLLVLGMCFFAGGIKFSEQGFGASATQLNSSLLTISVIAILLPNAFRFAVTAQSDPDAGQDILKVSHGVALILLFIYGSYLFFQLYSHATLYGDTSDDVIKSTKYAPREKKNRDGKGRTGAGTDLSSAGSPTDVETQHEAEEEDVEEPQLSLWMTLGLLAVVTVFIGVTAEWLVDSINGLVSSGSITKEFVGVILLPIVGNAAEHVTAVTVSVKDKLTLSLGVAVGSSIQIALFVIPFIMVLGWILGKPLTMLFDPFESVALFLAVMTVNYVVQDGKSNWLEGMILMCLYVILGTTFFFYPGVSGDSVNIILPKCT